MLEDQEMPNYYTLAGDAKIKTYDADSMNLYKKDFTILILITNPEENFFRILSFMADFYFTSTTLSSGFTSAIRWLRSIPKADSCVLV